ncbi:hypothetical protein VARIO8X_50140 [Burkholderiales bacterium 8X]|nr:hypothetical protein VARIO8X_50140 [Burkholderiales bacterium 8X]
MQDDPGLRCFAGLARRSPHSGHDGGRQRRPGADPGRRRRCGRRHRELHRRDGHAASLRTRERSAEGLSITGGPRPLSDLKTPRLAFATAGFLPCAVS